MHIATQPSSTPRRRILNKRGLVRVLLVTALAGTMAPLQAVSAYAAAPTSIEVSTNVQTTFTGQSVTATAQTYDPISSAYYLRIQDAAAGVYHDCAPGVSSCAITVTSAVAATHTFSGHLDRVSDRAILAISANQYATWANDWWLVSVQPWLVSGGQYSAVARTNADVGPTPYFTQIYSVPDGERLAVCGSGTVCETPTLSHTWAVAVVGPYNTTLDISRLEANSKSVWVTTQIH